MLNSGFGAQVPSGERWSWPEAGPEGCSSLAVEEQVPLELYHGAKVCLRCPAHLEFIRAVPCISLLGRGWESSLEKISFRNNENTRSWL